MELQSEKISTRFFFMLLAFCLFIGYSIFYPFWEVIILSIFIVVACNPAHKKIKESIKNDTYASLISTTLILLFILIPGAILTFVIIDQLIQLVPVVTTFLSETKDFNYYFENIPVLGAFYIKAKILLISSGTNIDFFDLTKKYFGNVANFTLEKGKSLLTNIGIVFADVFFILMTIFFLFRDGEGYAKTIYELVPLPIKEKDFLFEKFYQAVKAIFIGTILTAMVQAILGFIAYFVVDIKFSLFLGFATFIFSFLPFGGAAIVWFPIAIYCFMFKSIFIGIGMTLWGIFIISMSDNIVRPIFIGSQTNINTLVLFFGVFGGLQLFGFIGMFISPVLIVLINNVLSLYTSRINQNEETLEPLETIEE